MSQISILCRCMNMIICHVSFLYFKRKIKSKNEDISHKSAYSFHPIFICLSFKLIDQIHIYICQKWTDSARFGTVPLVQKPLIFGVLPLTGAFPLRYVWLCTILIFLYKLRSKNTHISFRAFWANFGRPFVVWFRWCASSESYNKFWWTIKICPENSSVTTQKKKSIIDWMTA